MGQWFNRLIVNNQFIAALLFLGLVWFVFEIKGLMVVLFTAFIIMSALLPGVNFLHGKKVPRILAVVLTFVLSLSVIVLLIFPLIPFFITQLEAFFMSFPRYLNNVSSLLHIDINTSEINHNLTSDFNSISRNAFGLTQKIFSGIFSLLTLLVISFYLLLDHERIKRSCINIFAKEKRQHAEETITKIEEKLGAWIRGQLLLSLIIGSTTWIALTLLGIDFALPLALLAGILEIVPTIGPIISAIPAIIIALTISPQTALLVTGVYIIIQALENNLFVPKIMEKAVGLNPIIVIMSVVIGGKILGVVGSLLAVPFVSCLIILFSALREKK